MRSQNIQPLYAVVISLLALLIATVALYQAKEARLLALSDIKVEELNSFVTPVFDEQSGKWSYFALFELSVSNQSGPAVVLQSVGKMTGGSGFLVPLVGQEIVNKKIPYHTFLVKQSIAEIRQNPRLLKNIMDKDMGEAARVDLKIEPGESKKIRIGISLNPYDEENKPLAQVVLLSYKLQFDNGKSYIYRRGFPIQPIKQ